jgi:hypothetical protein
MRGYPLAVLPVLLWAVLGSPVTAQAGADTIPLRLVNVSQSERLAELTAARAGAMLDLVAVSHELVSPDGGGGRRARGLLVAAQELADSVAFLDDEVIRLGGGNLEAGAPELTAAAGAALSALAGIVAAEHGRLMRRHALQDELRLFLGHLRLFDETGTPPAARSDGGGDPDPGCPVTACPITGFSPADVPLTHARLGDDPGAADASALTTASLARFQDQLARIRRLPEPELAREPGPVRGEAVAGTSLVGFGSAGDGVMGGGAKLGASWTHARPLAGRAQLTVEPSLGGRLVRTGPATAAEGVGDVRWMLAGPWGGGRSRWQVLSWQKGRYLSDPLPLPAYLEPGRLEAGLAGHTIVPSGLGWDVVVTGGGDLVRYAPAEWKVLDRQGVSASVGVARQGTSRSGRLALTGSHHAFNRPDQRREDLRLGIDADASFEGRVVARLSAGVARNDSRLPAYDYRSARVAAVLSAPWGGGSVQGYGAFTYNAYRNPGPEDDRVAPADQATGSILALQYARPLTPSRTLALRAEWSRSEAGFGSDFHNRVGTSVQLSFRAPR